MGRKKKAAAQRRPELPSHLASMWFKHRFCTNPDCPCVAIEHAYDTTRAGAIAAGMDDPKKEQSDEQG